MAIYRILCFDGGGVRGLFTATVVTRLETAFPGLVARCDLLAGTSVGGLLALGLADGRAPEELALLLRTEAARIFDDSRLDDLLDVGKAVGADYDLEPLERLLQREFGERTLRHLKKRVLVPAFDLDAPAERGLPRMWRPKFFHNFPGRDSDGGMRMVDVGLATSAAPTYFPSHQGYVDGGVVANNPALAAVAQALDARGAGRRFGDLVVLSIGSGIEPKRIPGERLDWGWGQWARPLVEILTGGVHGVVDFQCRQLLGARYRRIDALLEKGVALDDARPASLARLEGVARSVDLRPVVRWLRARGW